MIRKILSPVDLIIDSQNISKDTVTSLSSDINYPSIIPFQAIDDDSDIVYNGYIYETSSPISRIYDVTGIPETIQNDTITVLLVDSAGNPSSGTIRFHVGPKGSSEFTPITVDTITVAGIASYTFTQGLYVNRIDVVNTFISPTGEPYQTISAVEYSTSIIDESARVFIIQLTDLTLQYEVDSSVEYVGIIDAVTGVSIGLYTVDSGIFYTDRNITGYRAILFGSTIEPYYIAQVPTGNDLTAYTPLIAAGTAPYTVDSVVVGFTPTGLVIHDILGIFKFVTPFTGTYEKFGVEASDYVRISVDGHTSYYGLYSELTGVDALLNELDFIEVTVDDGTDPVEDALVVTNLGTSITNSDGLSYFVDTSPSTGITNLEIYKFGYETYIAGIIPGHTYSLTSLDTESVQIIVNDESGEPIKFEYSVRQVDTGSTVFTGFGDGQIILTAIDPEKTYLITVGSYGYKPLSELFVGTSLKNIILVLEETNVSIRGDIILNIYDESTGRKLNDVNVELDDLETNYFNSKTDNYGIVIFSDVIVGKTYNLKLTKDHYGYYVGNITLPADHSSTITFDPITVQNNIDLSYSMTPSVTHPILSISLGLEPTYSQESVNMTSNITDVNIWTSINWLGALGETKSSGINIFQSGRFIIPKNQQFTFGSNISTTTKGGLIDDYIVIPGTINELGDYYKLTIGDSVTNFTNMKSYSFTKSNISEGIALYFAQSATITLELEVNNSSLTDYSFVITSDFDTPIISYDQSTLTITGYLNLPYTITVRGPGVYYTGKVVFSSTSCKMNIPTSSIPQCGLTLIVADAFGEVIPSLSVLVTVMNTINGGLGGSLSETIKSFITNTKGELILDAPYHSIFTILSQNDTYPFLGFGTVPEKEQATLRISANGLANDVYTYQLTVNSVNVEAASVWITLDLEGKYTIAGPKTTDSSGNVSFNLISTLGVVYAWANKTASNIINHVESWDLNY